MNRILEREKKITNIRRLAALSEFKYPEGDPGSTKREENTPVFQPKAESVVLIWLSGPKSDKIS